MWLTNKELRLCVQWYLRHPDYSKPEGELTFNLLPSSHAVSGGFSEKQVLRQGEKICIIRLGPGLSGRKGRVQMGYACVCVCVCVCVGEEDNGLM